MFINQEEFQKKFENFVGTNYANFEFSGFVYKNTQKEKVEKIGLTLDLSIEAVQSAIKSNIDILICFHSPDKIKSTEINQQQILNIVKNKLSLYKCHLPLNFADKIGVHATMGLITELNVEPITFEYEGNYVTGGVYRIVGEHTLSKILTSIKNMDCPYVRIFNHIDSNRIYKNVLLSSGSGFKKEMFNQLPCDLIISGEAKHGMIIKARDMNIALIELGHYYSENEPLRIISEKMSVFLEIKVEYINIPFIEKIYEFRKQ